MARGPMERSILKEINISQRHSTLLHVSTTTGQSGGSTIVHSPGCIFSFYLWRLLWANTLTNIEPALVWFRKHQVFIHPLRHVCWSFRSTVYCCIWFGFLIIFSFYLELTAVAGRRQPTRAVVFCPPGLGTPRQKRSWESSLNLHSGTNNICVMC